MIPVQSLVLDLVNIDVYAKVYQNIPNGLRVIDIFRFLSWDKIFTNGPVTKLETFFLSFFLSILHSVMSDYHGCGTYVTKKHKTEPLFKIWLPLAEMVVESD